MENSLLNTYKKGFKDGIPIGLGYFAVAFSLGIAAKSAGVTAFEGFVASALTIASAGEYAGFTLIGAAASYAEMALMIFIANARYMLMSCALGQRMHPSTSLIHRIGVGFFITDEIFGISIAQSGYHKPVYTYGAATSSVPLWALGTSLGILMGNMLPLRVVSALSVALYGMFIAIIIPPCKTNKVITGAVIASFALSYIANHLALFNAISSGTKTIILTVGISAVVAILFPREPEAADE